MLFVVFPLLHEYVNGPAPEATLTLAEPLFEPQVVGCAVFDKTIPKVEVTDALAVAEHPPALTVTE